jgi:hypothetical protein
LRIAFSKLGDPQMKTAVLVLCAGIALTPIASAQDAYAGDGRVAAGVLGGLFAGTLFGSALASRPYYPPPPAYAAPAPVYVEPAPAPTCYWAEGEPVWNGYAWVPSRVQTCE